MTDLTLVRDNWIPVDDRVTASWDRDTRARGKGWSSMWTAAADQLHVTLLSELACGRWRDSGSVASAICDAGDIVRAERPHISHASVTEACMVFSDWLERFAPGSGLRGLDHLLRVRGAARWGQ